MKRFFSVFIVLALILTLAAGCAAPQVENGKLTVVATIFPEYDWVREILGLREPEVDLTLLLDNGADLHNYSPTVNDMVKIASCDLFLYVGGESDKWVPGVLKKATNPDMIVLNLMEILGDAVKEEEVRDGMQAEEEEEEEEGPENDEHVWLSLKNAVVICDKITEALVKADPDHAALYRANNASYAEKLNELDQEYADMVANAPKKTLLFGDRFPFRYLVDDYGLDYYAAFVGCSAETEASFETISFLAGKLDELGLGAVLTIEGSDQRIAQTIVSNTKLKNQNILSLNSLQSTTGRDVESGTKYLAVMRKNLETVREALQ